MERQLLNRDDEIAQRFRLTQQRKALLAQRWRQVGVGRQCVIDLTFVDMRFAGREL
jgi:hypothetical protein